MSQTDFHIDRAYGYLRILLALLVFWLSSWYLFDAMEYKPNASRVYVDMIERPMSSQNLTGFATHNQFYGKGSASVVNFGKEAILSLFNYHYLDLKDGSHKQKVMPFFSDEAYSEIYKSFFSLSYNRIVEKQEGIVISDVAGEIEYVSGVTAYPYDGNSTEVVMTYLIKGTLVVELSADDSNKEVYQFTLYVQRAPIQDRVRGYQLIRMELSS